MFAANTYLIRLARDEDAGGLARLAANNSHAPLIGRVMIGQIGGETAAAISLHDGQAIADTSRVTGQLMSCLRIRAQALRAYETTPSLRVRMLAGLASYDHPRASEAGRETAQRHRAASRAATNGRGRRERADRSSRSVAITG